MPRRNQRVKADFCRMIFRGRMWRAGRKLLLVDLAFLVPDGVGRATTCRVWGDRIPDLAQEPRASGGDPFSSEIRSPDSAPNSPHKEGSPPHSDPTPQHSVEENSAGWDRLMPVAEEVRNRGRTHPETTRSTIPKLCEDSFLTTEQFGKLLGLKPKGIRDRFLTPLFKEGGIGTTLSAHPEPRAAGLSEEIVAVATDSLHRTLQYSDPPLPNHW